MSIYDVIEIYGLMIMYFFGFHMGKAHSILNGLSILSWTVVVIIMYCTAIIWPVWLLFVVFRK